MARILAAVLIAAFSVGPVSAATVSNAPGLIAQGASSAQAGTITGVIRDAEGAPVANATVQLRGATTYTGTTDAQGAFSISNVTPGLYTVTASRPGYETASDRSFVVLAGENAPLQITMSVQSFSSLRTIATVRTATRGLFNQSTAAVANISSQTYLDQGNPQVTSVLNEIPGVQISLPNNSGNGAVPGAITFPNIRNGLSFETASLIDGHPLSVGRFGDYVTTFLNAFMFGNTEIVKGPGAMAPQVNFAIGGTVNFRTLDPTATINPMYTYGFTNHGGTYYNFGISDTVLNGRLGFVADVAGINEPSSINGQQVYFSSPTGVAYLPNGTTDVLSFNDQKSPIPGTTSSTFNNYQLTSCCYAVKGDYNNTSELVKLRYKLSSATTATVSYLGSQTFADQNGNTSQLTPSTFQPPAGYSGSVPIGARFLASNIFPAGALETNNEPIFQAEVASTLGKDTVLGRYYHASIGRFLTEGGNENSFVTLFPKLSGVNVGPGGNTVYNDIVVPVRYYNFFRQNETDLLSGWDLQYGHPYGESNNLTAAVSQTNSGTTYWSAANATPQTGTGNQWNGQPIPQATPNTSIPTGSGEIFTTIMLRSTNDWGTKWNTILTLYDNLYKFTYPISCGTPCQPSGSNAVFQTRNASHFDPRLGVTYHANPNLVLRGALGSAIAPPYINLLSKLNAPISWNGTSQSILVAQNNPNLVAETAFGWDIGADYRYKNNYYVSTDIYRTNLFNQFMSSVSDAGPCYINLYPGSNCPAQGQPAPELFFSTNTNLSNARYEGIELSVRHVPLVGLGWIAQGSTQRGYAYNLPANFYCNFAPTATRPCVPANYNTNLAIVPNQNFSGGNTNSVFVPGTPGNTPGYSGAANGVANQSVPYLQAYAEINYHTPQGIYASFGATFFGKNNSYSEPPFAVARASVRVPVTQDLALQIAGNNIFNQYSGLFPIVGGGVGIPLANGGLAASNGNVLGPATWAFILTKSFGRTDDGRPRNSSR